MSKVWFLGMGAETPEDVLAERLAGRRVWALNDWYTVYPWLKSPERVYNVHEEPNEHPDGSGRFVDWRRVYVESGAEIVTVDDHGLPNQRRLDMRFLIGAFGVGFFGSSLGFMFADAIMEGIAVVEMEGFPIRSGCEHTYQIPSVIENIEAARKAGIEVRTPHYGRWVKEMESDAFRALVKGFPNASSAFYGRAIHRRPQWASA